MTYNDISKAFILIAITLAFISLNTNTWAQGEQLPEDIKKLNESYAREIARVLPPIQEKYIAALERLLESYTRAGSFDAALTTKKEIEKAKAWDSVPLEQFRSGLNEDLNRKGFEDWLKTKSFSFRGVTQVTLEFDEKKVRWIVGNKPQEYDYKIKGSRSVIVEGAQEFNLEFANDLSSGTFESNVGKYSLTIEDRQ